MDIELCIFSQCMYKHQCIDNFHHPHTHVEISQLVKDVFAAGLWQVCGQFALYLFHQAATLKLVIVKLVATCCLQAISDLLG